MRMWGRGRCLAGCMRLPVPHAFCMGLRAPEACRLWSCPLALRRRCEQDGSAPHAWAWRCHASRGMQPLISACERLLGPHHACMCAWPWNTTATYPRPHERATRPALARAVPQCAAGRQAPLAHPPSSIPTPPPSAPPPAAVNARAARRRSSAPPTPVYAPQTRASSRAERARASQDRAAASAPWGSSRGRPRASSCRCLSD